MAIVFISRSLVQIPSSNCTTFSLEGVKLGSKGTKHTHNGVTGTSLVTLRLTVAIALHSLALNLCLTAHSTDSFS